jgi:hypothetical protein
MRVVDLFSGLGGFSQAFLDRGHDVTRYDVDPQFKDVPNTIIKDILELHPGDLQNLDVILAGIDCTHLTYANADPKEYNLAKRLALHTMQLIDKSAPSFFAVENPKASRLWNIIGPPNYITEWGGWGTPYRKPTGILGRLPLIDWPMRYVEPAPKESWDRTRFLKNKFSYLAPRKSSERSLIPYPFSLALCIAIEQQRPPLTILDFVDSAQEQEGG